MKCPVAPIPALLMSTSRPPKCSRRGVDHRLPVARAWSRRRRRSRSCRRSLPTSAASSSSSGCDRAAASTLQPALRRGDGQRPADPLRRPGDQHPQPGQLPPRHVVPPSVDADTIATTAPRRARRPGVREPGNPGRRDGCNGFRERDAGASRPARARRACIGVADGRIVPHRGAQGRPRRRADRPRRDVPRARVRRPARPRRRRGRLHGRHPGGVPHRLPLPRPPRHDEPHARPAPSPGSTSTCGSWNCAANCTATYPAARASSAATSTARTSPARRRAATRIRTSSPRTPSTRTSGSRASPARCR